MRGKKAKQIRKVAHKIFPMDHEYGQDQKTGAIVLMPSAKKLYRKMKEAYTKGKKPDFPTL